MSAQSWADGHRTLSCPGAGNRGHLHAFPSLPCHCSPSKALLFQEVSRRTRRVPKTLLKARFTQPSMHPPPHDLHLRPWKTPHGKVLVSPKHSSPIEKAGCSPSLQPQPQLEGCYSTVSPGCIPFLAHAAAGGARSPAILGSPGLPREVDGECRLWEEMTMFIVWIEYFSWPSLYCSVPFISLFFLPPPRHPEHADSPLSFLRLSGMQGGNQL